MPSEFSNYTLYYNILGERKDLASFPTWHAAWLEAERRKHNYCGDALYIRDGATKQSWDA